MFDAGLRRLQKYTRFSLLHAVGLSCTITAWPFPPQAEHDTTHKPCRPALLPVPDFAIRLLLGEGATVVLDGQRVLPLRAQEAGYDFKFSQVMRGPGTGG